MVIVIINIIIQKAVTVISISPYGTKEKVTKRNEIYVCWLVRDKKF